MDNDQRWQLANTVLAWVNFSSPGWHTPFSPCFLFITDFSWTLIWPSLRKLLNLLSFDGFFLSLSFSLLTENGIKAHAPSVFKSSWRISCQSIFLSLFSKLKSICHPALHNTLFRLPAIRDGVSQNTQLLIEFLSTSCIYAQWDVSTSLIKIHTLMRLWVMHSEII